jgi:hypothetical protein
VTAHRPTAPTPCPHYVPPMGGRARVTLTVALERDEFLGTFEGEAVQVLTSGVDALRIGRTIREHGTAIYDAPPSSVRAADPDGWTIRERAANSSRLAFERGYLRAVRGAG